MKQTLRIAKSGIATAALLGSAIALAPVASQATPTATLEYTINGTTTDQTSSSTGSTTLGCANLVYAPSAACVGGSSFSPLSITGYVVGTSGIDLGVDAGGAAGTISTTYTANNLSGSSADIANLLASFTGQYSGTNYVKMYAYADASNASTFDPNSAVLIGQYVNSSLTTSLTQISYTNLLKNFNFGLGAYSLTLMTSFQLTGAGSSFESSDNHISNVPEPSDLGMMGLGLMLIGLLGLKVRQGKYRNKSAKTA